MSDEMYEAPPELREISTRAYTAADTIAGIIDNHHWHWRPDEEATLVAVNEALKKILEMLAEAGLFYLRK